MTIYNREDSRTVLPQIEKHITEYEKATNERIDKLLDYEDLTSNLSFHQCANGSYSCCYRIGNIVFLSFNIQITTSTSNYAYITGIPKALHNASCAGGGASAGRFFATPDGSLKSDGALSTGWYGGSIVYICEEK